MSESGRTREDPSFRILKLYESCRTYDLEIGVEIKVSTVTPELGDRIRVTRTLHVAGDKIQASRTLETGVEVVVGLEKTTDTRVGLWLGVNELNNVGVEVSRNCL